MASKRTEELLKLDREHVIHPFTTMGQNFGIVFEKAKGIKLFITGLSNETVAVDHPVAKDQMGKPLRVFLRKTLELSYRLGGDPTFRSDTRLLFESKRWVMR